MTRRLVCLSVFLVLAFASSFSEDATSSPNQSHSASVASARKNAVRGTNNREAMARWSRVQKTSTPPTTNIGFLSGIQNASGGGTFPNYPAVTGDFTGTGLTDAAAIVNTAPSNVAPKYAIAAALNNGKGGFTVVPTLTGAVESDAIFVGDLNGDGKDDILIVHPPAATGDNTLIQGWTSNGDGTFKAQGTLMGVTTNGFVWATLFDVNGDGKLDLVLADASNPGNIWTALGNGDGTFQAATHVPFTGALLPLTPGNSGVQGNPMVFADFNGDGKLDFAGAALAGGSVNNNQIVVYLNNGSGGYTGPVPLATPDGVYHSCFLGGGTLKTGGSFGQLVSANCIDNNITIYVNNGGTFTAQPYVDVESNPVAVTVADLNGDGNTDIVASCFRSADIKVMLGDGTGGVTPAVVGYATGGSPLVPPLIGNFNGASNPVDVVVPDDEFSFVYLEGYGDGSFRSAVNYYSEPGGGVHAAAFNIATGDFNGDGIPDFVIGNGPIGSSSSPNYSVTVFLSNANGTLNPGVNYSNSALTDYSLQYVAVADFDKSGNLDIAATDNFNGAVQIFAGNGKGTFAAGATYPTDAMGTNPNPVGLVVGDFNGDGWPDLAVVNNYGNPASSAKVSILLNNQKGGFNTAVTYPLSTVATEITAAALVNGSNTLDLVVPLYGTNAAPGSAVAILLGNGDGTFKPESDVNLVNGSSTYLNPYAVAVGDLNGDGKVDLAVTIEDQTHFHQGIAVAFGNGNGTFQAPTLLASTNQNPLLDVPLPGYVQIADLNKDGIPDLVYSNSEFSTVGILYGQGGGAFHLPVEFPADRWAWGLALVDMYGDGATDVVVSGNSFDFSGVAVLFNSGGDKIALTSSANPAPPGSVVTFTATVTSPVKGVTTPPTGKVTFNNGTTALGSANLTNGVATFKTSPLAGGAYSITAQYSGDIDFLPNTSAALSEMVPAYTLSASPSTQTVSPGSPAAYKITQAILGGYSGKVSYSTTACSGLPTGATCSFSSSSITGAGTTTLTIATTGPTSALLAPPALTPQKGALQLWASLGGLGLVGMVVAGDWSSRKRRGMGIGLAVLAMVLLMTLVGCGGGSSSSGGGGGGGGGGGTGGTPAGTYAVTVTVTGPGGAAPSNGPLKVTLIVN